MRHVGYYEYDNQSVRCDQCGETLTERQERYCSARCRQAAYRERKQPQKQREWKTCPLCGEPFEVTHPGKKFCDYWDEADTECKQAQDDMDEAVEEELWERRNAQCENCGKPAGYYRGGSCRLAG
jgi:ribosomal protein S27E